MLSAFQGLPACTDIAWGRGVCGMAAATGVTQVVADVREIENYIACHEEVRSEVVVPYKASNGDVTFVLDADSSQLAFFRPAHIHLLGQVCQLIAPYVDRV